MGSKVPASIDLASSNGAPIGVSATASVGDLIFQSVARAGQWDEVTVDAWHTNPGVAHTLTFEVLDTDGTTVLATLPVEFTTAANQARPVDGWRFRNGVYLAAYADTADIFFVKVRADQLQTAVV